MRRVMIVSRDPAVLKQAGSLMLAGCRVECLLSGAELLERLQRESATLLLLHPDPEDMSAAELVQRIERLERRPPWAVVGPDGDVRGALAWIRRGALDYLPIAGAWEHGLVEEMEQLLARADSQGQLDQARREREARTRHRDLLLDIAPGLLVAASPEGLVLACNEAARRCGLQAGGRLPEAGGAGDWTPPAAIFGSMECIRREQELGGLLYDVHWCSRNGRAVCLAMEKGPRLIEERRRRRMENRRLLAQKMDSLNELASHLAHDISNQLLVIMGYSDMLRDHLADDAGAAQWTQSIRKAAEGVSQHTRRLISFTRGRGGQFGPLDLHALLRQVAERMRPEHPLIQMRLRLDAAECRIWGDAGRLEDALHNICRNACEAMPRGGLLVLQSRNLRPEGGPPESDRLPDTHIQVSVRDTGIGMSEETLERIFDPFFTTRKREGGAGLGLSSAWSIVRGHKGNLDADSTLGNGTQIRILLPLHRENTAPAADSENPGGHVLVVDDDEVVRGVVQSILRALGWQVSSFSSAVETLAWFDAQRPHLDLALLDLRMPHMNGWELLGELRRRDPRLRALIMTAWADDLLSQQVDPKVVLGVLKKPFELEELHTHVMSALAIIQAERLGHGAG
jgi:signal transduction histidine kinase